MTTHYGFTQGWYAGRINQDMANMPKDSGQAIAHAILCGSAYIAQAIDNAIGDGKHEHTVAESMRGIDVAITEISGQLESIAEHIEESKQ